MTRRYRDASDIPDEKSQTMKMLYSQEHSYPSALYREQFWWRQDSSPAPHRVDNIVPNQAKVGGPNVLVRIIGAGFTPDSEILWNGGAERTIFVSGNELQTVVEPGTASGPGTVPISVQTGALETNEVPFRFI